MLLVEHWITVCGLVGSTRPMLKLSCSIANRLSIEVCIRVEKSGVVYYNFPTFAAELNSFPSKNR